SNGSNSAWAWPSCYFPRKPRKTSSSAPAAPVLRRTAGAARAAVVAIRWRRVSFVPIGSSPCSFFDGQAVVAVPSDGQSCAGTPAHSLARCQCLGDQLLASIDEQAIAHEVPHIEHL